MGKKNEKLRETKIVEPDFRTRAESIIKQNPRDLKTPADDAFAMIHELQVHQVELQIMNDELRMSKEITENALQKLKLIIETASIGLWEINFSNDHLTLDKSSEKIFELKRGDKNYPETIDDLVSADDLPHFKNGLKTSLVTGAPFETVFRSRIHGKGSKFIRAKAFVTKSSSNKSVIDSFSGVFFDITGMRDGSEALITKLNEEMLRSNKELQAFAYVVSHDLQEPLRMVTSFTQLLSKQYGDKLDEMAREYISFAVDGAKRMYGLLNGLLEYSRVNTRGQEFTVVDMNEAFQSACNNLDVLIHEREVVIKSDKLPKIYADASQMIRVFQNLISNSIKFSESRPYIYVSSTTERKRIVFMVRDNGIGIDRQYHEKVFQIFQRLGPRDRYEGTGIGLAVCKNIMDRHEGQIWLESTPGKGSTFYFSIPVSRETMVSAAEM